MVLATAGPSALWYLTRATGAVTLVLLTASVALGVANVGRLQSARWPRFVVEGLHRNVSLLAIVVLAVHIVTTVLDPSASIHLLDAVIPFISTYRPFWLGLGAFASDLLLAIALTSMARRRLGHRAWRATHWFAYACWPIALLHAVGTGSDIKQLWMQALLAGCLVAVVVAIWARVGFGWPARRGLRGKWLRDHRRTDRYHHLRLCARNARVGSECDVDLQRGRCDLQPSKLLYRQRHGVAAGGRQHGGIGHHHLGIVQLHFDADDVRARNQRHAVFRGDVYGEIPASPSVLICANLSTREVDRRP